MILRFTRDDDDIKFLCYAAIQDAAFVKSETLSLVIDNETIEELDKIVERIFRLHGEEPTPKGISDFKKARTAPRPIKGPVSVLSLLNYINLVKNMLQAGTLKNKDYIDEFTGTLSFPFDPDFFLLEIKPGYIESIDVVPDLDKLFCEKVAADKEYTICSGLRGYYKKEDLLHNTYLFLLNIKKTKFRGTESEGMICCTKDGENVEPIKVDKPRNTRLFLEGHLQIFEDISYGKIDLAKGKYKSALDSFKVVEHHLVFKDIRVTCGGEYIKTSVRNGPVS